MKFQTFYFLLLAIIAFTTCGYGQSKTNTKSDTSRTQILGMRDIVMERNFPLTKDTAGLYPSKIEVEGLIIAVSPLWTSCGVICGCGTVKILLTSKIPAYTGDTIFIAMPCFSVTASHYIGRTAKIKLRILTKDNKECYWNADTENHFDSHGTPFYIPETEYGRLELK